MAWQTDRVLPLANSYIAFHVSIMTLRIIAFLALILRFGVNLACKKRGGGGGGGCCL